MRSVPQPVPRASPGTGRPGRGECRSSAACCSCNLTVVFQALWLERSVSRAAQRLGLSQSATSHALSRLRSLLGDPLFTRTPAGLRPTPRAEAIADSLNARLYELERVLLRPPAFDPAQDTRRFNVGAPDYAEFVLFPSLLEYLSVNAPEVSIWVRPSAPDIATPLARGDWDVAFAPLSMAQGTARLRTQRLFNERFVCLVRKGHRLARKPFTPAQFAKEKHVFIAPGGRPGGVVDDTLQPLGLKRTVAVAVPHFLVAPYFVVNTDLVLTVAERIARAFAKVLPLKILEPPMALPGFTAAMIWHERTDHDPAQVWLRQVIADVAAKLK